MAETEQMHGSIKRTGSESCDSVQLRDQRSFPMIRNTTLVVTDKYTASAELCVESVRNGNVEVPVYFLKAKQGYTVRKMEQDKWI
jgi:hypothetical protein